MARARVYRVETTNNDETLHTVHRAPRSSVRRAARHRMT